VRRLRRCLKFEGLERAKKNSPFLGLKAQTVLKQLFCFIRFSAPHFGAKEGLGRGVPGPRAAARPVLRCFCLRRAGVASIVPIAPPHTFALDRSLSSQEWWNAFEGFDKLSPNGGSKVRATKNITTKDGPRSGTWSRLSTPRRSGRAEQRRGEGIRKARCLSAASLRLSPSTRAAQGTGKAGPDCGSPFFGYFLWRSKESNSPAGAKPGFSTETNQPTNTTKPIANKQTNTPATCQFTQHHHQKQTTGALPC
jgi:hypothetical protein